jgi:hypothetical protein
MEICVNGRRFDILFSLLQYSITPLLQDRTIKNLLINFDYLVIIQCIAFLQVIYLCFNLGFATSS